jgi:hypothetical protein
MLKRILESQGVALPTVRSLLKTMVMEFAKGSEVLALSKSFWKFPDPLHITNSLRYLVPASFTSVAQLCQALGAHFRKVTRDGQEIVCHRVGRPEVRGPYYGPDSPNMFIGLLRKIITDSPGYLVNTEILLESLGPRVVRTNPDVNPDHLWNFGSEDPQAGLESASALTDRIAKEVESIMPDKYQHCSKLFSDLKESITDFMKVSVTDLLPSALPAHLDLFETITEMQSSAVLASYRRFRQDPMCTSEMVYSFPERTDTSRAPMYLLEYTNAIRLCATNPDVIPRPEVAHLYGRFLCTPDFQPYVNAPRVGYEQAFVRHTDPSRKTLETMLRMKLQESGDFFKSNLVK